MIIIITNSFLLCTIVTADTEILILIGARVNEILLSVYLYNNMFMWLTV